MLDQEGNHNPEVTSVKEAENYQLRQSLIACKEEVQELMGEIDQKNSTLRFFQDELEGIRESRSYRFIQYLRSFRIIQGFLLPFTRWLLDRFHRKTIVKLQPDDDKETVRLEALSVISRDEFSSDEQNWIIRLQKMPKPVSVRHPDWLGIRSSSQQLFSENFDLGDVLTESTAAHYARLFIEAACPAVVIQGFPSSYIYLINALKKQKPDLPIYIIWHGGFVQTDVDAEWNGFKTIEELCRDRKISKWGFVKKGMAEIMALQGLDTGFVMNYVRDIPDSPSIPMDGGPHLMIWSNWQKKPYVMLAATALIPGGSVYLSGYAPDRVELFAGLLGIKLHVQSTTTSPSQMNFELAKYDLNLYVTLFECAPMLPLESLASGAPCLIGPNSHFFEDNLYLHSRLVVKYPDRAEIMAQFIQQALEEREQIIYEYQSYAKDYNTQARTALKQFLDGLDA